MKVQINNVFEHPDLLADFRNIAQNLNTEEEFMEFLQCYNRVLTHVIQDPFNSGIQLEHQLIAWYKKVFFSVMKPLPKKRPNMRLIYRYDLDFKSFYILAVGERNAKTKDSIYNIVNLRDKTKWNKVE